MELYRRIVDWARAADVDESLLEAVEGARQSPPAGFMDKEGWVLVAFRNALWQLLHAPSLEEGVVDTVMRGGDTDTNAAICGALLGAVHGCDALPPQWVDTLRNCQPREDLPHVRHPRPERYWPVDALDLAERMVFRAGAA
jgi:ADP-ribosylglycohydrolase